MPRRSRPGFRCSQSSRSLRSASRSSAVAWVSVRALVQPVCRQLGRIPRTMRCVRGARVASSSAVSRSRSAQVSTSWCAGRSSARSPSARAFASVRESTPRVRELEREQRRRRPLAARSGCSRRRGPGRARARNARARRTPRPRARPEASGCRSRAARSDRSPRPRAAGTAPPFAPRDRAPAAGSAASPAGAKRSNQSRASAGANQSARSQSRSEACWSTMSLSMAS